MAFPNRTRMKIRGARRRLRRWAATGERIDAANLGERGWDWWPVWQHPWNAWNRPAPSAQALRFVVETFVRQMPAWEAFGRSWHADHPHDTAPVVSLYIRADDLYRCELGLMVGDRAAAFWRDWNAEDRPIRAVPSWLAASAPGLMWRPLWVYEAWDDDDLADWTPTERRRLERYGPLVPSETSPGYQTAKTGIAWVGIQPV